MSVDHLGIHLGPVTFSFFGLILLAALVAGGFWAYRTARREGENPEHVIDLLTWGSALGIVVARLFYVWNPPPFVSAFYDRRWYLTHPFDLQVGPLAIWSGGLGMAGALVGGVLGVVLALWRRKLDLPLWADILTPGALLGLAIAAWANGVHRQMYGPPTALPWGVSIASPAAPYNDYTLYPPGTTRFHPTPAYVSLWALVTLGVVLLAGRRFAARMQPGDRFLLAAVVYLPGLFLLDFLRVDVNRGLLGLTGMQSLALLALVALVWLGVRRCGIGVGGGVAASGENGDNR